jgi:hypothetical protein
VVLTGTGVSKEAGLDTGANGCASVAAIGPAMCWFGAASQRDLKAPMRLGTFRAPMRFE